MSTPSLVSSVLSALGSTSSGIDVTSAVNAILYADRASERQWQTQQTALAAQATALTQLESEASSVTDSVNALGDFGGALSTVTASSSNSAAVTASSAPGSASGSHTITVQALASTGSWYSSSVASSTAVLGAGSFSLSQGSGAATTISTTGQTLDQLAASINTQSLGLRASVITDSSGARLSLVSDASGAAADITVAAATGLTFIRPPGGIGSDAQLTVDGVPITSASNTVTGSIAGLTLNLQSVSSTATTVSVAPDSSAIQTAVSAFVSSYNTLITDVNSQFTYNPTTSTAGALSGDSAVAGLQSALLAGTNYSSGSTSFSSLASLGISTNADGTLSLDASTLDDAITDNSTAVATFFQGSALNGFAANLAGTLSTYTNISGGAFTVDLSSISNENTDLTNQTTSLEAYLTTEQTRLTTLYNTIDVALQQLPEHIKQVQALLDPNSSSSNS